MNETVQPEAAPAPTPPPREVGKKLKRLAIIGPLLALALILGYRFAGTRTFTGVVQRVYEKEGEYRVELRDSRGEVLVAANHDMKFPYFKLNSADVHADLHRFSQTGDLVKAEIWGFRMEWFSAFPNVIDVTFLESKRDRTRKRAERVADAALRVLMEKGILKGGDGVRDDLIEAMGEALDPLPE